MILFVAILSYLVFPSQNSFAAASFACPPSIQLTIDIGQLAITDGDDSDFAELSGARYAGIYNLNSQTDGCIYVESKSFDVTATHHKRYAEIKSDPRRGLTFNFETYTSTSKVVGISTVLDERIYQGDYEATVFERSGVHKKLGDASVVISDVQ